MPVIQQFDPLTAAASAIGDLNQRKRTASLEDVAQKFRERQQGNVERKTSADITQGEAQTDIARGHLGNETTGLASRLQTEAQDRAIKASSETFQTQMRPLLLAAQQAQTKLTNQQATTSAEQAALAVVERKLKEFEASLAHKFGEPRAKAEVDQMRASLGLTQAQTRETNAQADYYGRSPGIGAGGGRGTTTERSQAAYTSAIDSLSPTAQQFYDMLYSTNNPPTRAQAMLALKAAMQRRGSGSMNKDDEKSLETLINSRESQFVTPATQGAARRADARTATGNERDVRAQRERNFSDVIAKGKGYRALPPIMQETVRHLIVDLGMDVNAASTEIQGSSLDAGAKQRILQALTGG